MVINDVPEVKSFLCESTMKPVVIRCAYCFFSTSLLEPQWEFIILFSTLAVKK